MKTAVFIATSLDGFIARPDDSIDWLMRPQYLIEGEDYGYADFMSSITCLMMGRRTFDVVRKFDSWPYADKRLMVISKSVAAVPPDFPHRAESFVGSPSALLQQLEADGEQGVYIDGGQLIQSCLQADLIDELTVTRLPLLLGAGLSLFGDLGVELAFEHLHTQSYQSGLVQSRYRRLRNAD